MERPFTPSAGLSYTKFGFKDAAVSANEAELDGLDVTVDVTNEVPLRAVSGGLRAERENTPDAQLKGLAKVGCSPVGRSESRFTCRWPPSPLCNEEGTPIVEAGSYSVYVGASQPDARSVALMVRPPKLTVTQSAAPALDL